MDFVDLDKVLDEFEEEEKQALSIVPGQELRPSGYLEFLEKHQEQEWKLLNPNKFSSSSGYAHERLSAREPVNVAYDDPYDSFSTSKLSIGTSSHTDSFSHNGYGGGVSEGKKTRSKSAIVTNLTRISTSGDDVNNVYTSAMNAPERKGIANYSERRGTIAYQPIEVQTDALSPLSEQELLLSPFPKTDIIVDGHGDTSVAGELKPSCVVETESYRHEFAGTDNVPITTNSYTSAHMPADVVNNSQILHSESRSSEEAGISSRPIQFIRYSSIVSPRDSGIGYSLPEQTVGFHDVGSEHMEECDINRYLNEFDEHKVKDSSRAKGVAPPQTTTFDSINIQSNVNQNEISSNENDDGRPDTAHSFQLHLDSLPVILKSDALPAASSGINYQDPDIVLDVDPCSKSNVLNNAEHGSVPVARVTGDNISNGESEENNIISHAQISDGTNFDVDVVNRQIVFNSIINGKMEIETILDDIEQSESASSGVHEHLSQGRMEIENILDDIIYEQQNNAKNDYHNAIHMVNSNMDSSHLKPVTQDPHIAEGRSSEASNMENDSNSLDLKPSSRTKSSVMLGARPKDPSAIKKNRPNSLLGLSKVNFDAPGILKPEVDAEGTQINQQVMDVDAAVQSHQSSNGKLSESIPAEPQTANEARQRSDVHSTEKPDTKPVLHDFSGPTESFSSDQSEARSEELDAIHSEGMDKMKRPTSLNLPVRPEFGMSEDHEDSSASSPSETAGRAENEDTNAMDGNIDSAPIVPSELGQRAPFWIPDTVTDTCMICQVKFTMWKRRHHCRACGKLLCATCCNQKAYLPYMENKEARICVECHIHLNLGSGPNSCYPNPSNPSEYCSKVPPTQQVSNQANPPVVMVPTGVLRTTGGQKRFGEPKQVMFSDGIRPGGELTELDGPEQTRPSRKSARTSRKTAQQLPPTAHKLREDSLARSRSLIPEHGLPHLIASPTETAEESQMSMYAVNKNLSVEVKIVNLDCCVERICWCFVSQGMDTAGQSELIVLLELNEEELVSTSPSPPRDMFMHFQTIYEEALKGSTIEEMGHFIFHENNFGNKDHAGFLFIPPTFQCLSNLPLPEQPYLCGILLQKWEVPWARVFPIRLMLRLGAEYRYYPCPLVSVRNRKPVFFEIGHTIINLLADFRSYQYMLSQIRGVAIHMENKKTIISFPRNRYSQIMKVVRNSNEHVMALGSSFSTLADSHLVCIQSEDGTYQTQAINIQNKQRLVTGASFVVFNGALKSSSGLRAKSSIVEDGLMIQVLPETLASIKEAMKNMANYTIQCGPNDAPDAEDVVELRWVDNDKKFNIGVKSYIDGTPLEGVENVSVKSPSDFLADNVGIRWTRVYFLQHQESSSSHFDPMDLSRLMEDIAEACCAALLQHLDELKKEDQVKLGLRVNLNSDNIGYEIGSKGQSLPAAMINNLDTFLVPIVHQASEEGVVMELVFRIVH